MMNFKKWIPFFPILGLISCSTPQLSVSQLRVDRNYLASTHVQTPDPRQDNPPFGQMLIIDWRVPDEILKKNPEIVLYILFRDYTQKQVKYPLKKASGTQLYFLLNDEYEETKGLITYKAEIVTEDRQVYKDWKHQMWVNLITLDAGEDIDFQENIESYVPEDHFDDQPNENEDAGTI